MSRSENKPKAKVSRLTPWTSDAVMEGPKDRRFSGADEAAVQCQLWLATNGAIQRLLQRWSRLEAHLVADEGWFERTKAEQHALPQAAELRVIDARVDELQKRQQALLKVLLRSRARSVNGAAKKVAVVASLVDYEDNPEAHTLIRSCLHDLAALGAGTVEPTAGKQRDHHR